ncbi:hypothetical protein PZ895_07235 [Mesorhizobium sp. YIM 152430]|uniref:hypothetical protein n=1 Tax=Mesorhizobium sp. YIM 152430 TaxID=3031761 RepID=UPI0023DCB864|nr:hypothetical protein [Mesorhizobium sp. YIM 152430]MDF1599566.1 hypothetical protein [Mesorhizobium sp. YIM 152430]
MSRVLLATSLIAALPLAAQAGSISVLQELKGPAPSIIARGTPAEPKVEAVVPTKAETRRVVTPMVMRGGISDGTAPVLASRDADAPEAESDAETNGGGLE